MLILMPTLKDAATTFAILRDNGVLAHICTTLKEVCNEITLGAGAAILPEEIILSDPTNILKETLEGAPSWSDFPILVLTPAGKDSPASIRALESIGHMTLMTRPIQIAELLSAVKTALRDRQRQYAMRHYIEEMAVQAQALRTSEHQFRQLADSIPQLAWIADENGEITWYNQRWYDYTGMTFEEMRNGGWEKINAPVERTRILATWNAALASGEPFQDTFPLRRHDGQMRWHLTRALPIRDEKGKAVRWFGTNTDITEQREALDKANAANIAKTEFLSNMSHEIRTPMNAVIGLSSLLAMSQPLTARQSEFIKTLQLSADSLLALINDLLDIAKIESRTVELEEIPFSLARLIHEIISIMSVRAKEKGIEFITDIGLIEDREFSGDPTRIRQILTNLCSNAVKFTQEGSITLTVHSSSRLQGDRMDLRISIADTGIGIPENKLATIFDKFTQADSSINRKFGGSGLGLAISKTLVELMSGRIEVKSVRGKGTTFTVSLPLKINASNHAAPQSVASPPAASYASTPHKPCVLLVEDYEANILVATAYLEEFGYGCDVAVNGIQAVEKYKNNHYGAILMDVQMQDMNGFQATENIRKFEKQEARRRVPIIGMTAHALAGDRERCIAAGMDDYISKPFSPAILRRKLTHFTRLKKSA